MNTLYSLRNVTRRFGERDVLHIDELDIEPREIYALLGANGAGKSTLMRILAFLDAPSGGELVFRGKRVSAGQEARFRPGVVWVPQFPVMFTGSLLYNVEYPMALAKIAKNERRQRALELLESVSLGHLAEAPAHKLSGGESQRASIARALAAGAEVILFDEPTANVDQRSLGDFIALVLDIWERQKLSILITTHNAALAAALCRRQIFLVEGKLVRQHVLPGGGTAWPAILSAGAGGLTARIPYDATTAFPTGTAFPRSACLRGLEDFAAGVSLRLEPMPGQMVDILLEDETSRTLARSITLGSVLNVDVTGDPRETA
ncbi:MAG: ATP-binding cassette domain-containing protein [Desulfovibrionaceae bacterium]|nr:ATP-binding cassette domain-containing protein [Desulfovibrionaceae bacterium]